MSETREDPARQITNWFRVARAEIRFFLKYTSRELSEMTDEQFIQAYEDVNYLKRKYPRLFTN